MLQAHDDGLVMMYKNLGFSLIGPGNTMSRDGEPVFDELFESILREADYGILDSEVEDFVAYCNHCKAAQGCYRTMADKYTDTHRLDDGDAGDLYQATKNYLYARGRWHVAPLFK
jgi:hypothetical protein